MMVFFWAATLCVSVAAATDGVWASGNTGNWSESSNWEDGIIASGAGATVILESGGAITQDVDGLTIGTIRNLAAYGEILAGSIRFDNMGQPPFVFVQNDEFRLGSAILTADFPILKGGPGKFTINTANNYFDAGLIVKEGVLEIRAGSGRPIGGGSLTLKGESVLSFAFNDQNYEFAVNEGMFLGFSGVPSLSPNRGSITFGFVGAAPNSVVNRVDYGVLRINTTLLGGGARVFFNGGISTVNGLVTLPMLNRGHFVTYDSLHGLTNAVHTIGLQGGATSLASVETSTTLASDTSVHALRVIPASGGVDVTLTLDPEVTISVGDGIHPAMVYLGEISWTSGRPAISGGTLDFGSSEGVIMFGGQAPWKATTLSSVIAGSGGVTYACIAGEAGRLTLTVNPTYTGATRIVKGPLAFSGVTRGFSGDDVYIYGDDVTGGQLQLASSLGAITNTFHVSGVGSRMKGFIDRYEKPTGAVTFANTAEISGLVTLTGDVRFSVPGNAAHWGLISGSISGDHRVELGYEAIGDALGIVKLSGENTYTGATRVSGGTLELLDSHALPASSPVEVVADLVFNFPEDAVFLNPISGAGRIIQRGGGRICLLNARHFSGDRIEENGTIHGPPAGTVITIR